MERSEVDHREEGVMIETNFLGLESLELEASMGGILVWTFCSECFSHSKAMFWYVSRVGLSEQASCCEIGREWNWIRKSALAFPG